MSSWPRTVKATTGNCRWSCLFSTANPHWGDSERPRPAGLDWWTQRCQTQWITRTESSHFILCDQNVILCCRETNWTCQVKKNFPRLRMCVKLTSISSYTKWTAKILYIELIIEIHHIHKKLCISTFVVLWTKEKTFLYLPQGVCHVNLPRYFLGKPFLPSCSYFIWTSQHFFCAMNLLSRTTLFPYHPNKRLFFWWSALVPELLKLPSRFVKTLYFPRLLYLN